jgi:Flp pilus assembly protein TadD
VRTQHFRLFADLERAPALRIAAQLEQDLDALGRAMFTNVLPQNDVTDVVVFAKERDFQHFVPAQVTGLFYRNSRIDPEAPNLVVTSGELDETTRTTLLHELTHDLFARNFGAAPVWLNEGWAEYFSTLRIEAGKVRIGSAPRGVTFTSENEPFLANYRGQTIVAIPISELTPPSQLLPMRHADFYQFGATRAPEANEPLKQTGRYLGAWAFVHMLRNGEGATAERFSTFLELARTSHVDDAWSRAFNGVDPRALDRELGAYLRKGELAVFTLPYGGKAQRAETKTEELSDSEVHLLWARLFVHHMSESRDAEAHARAELSEALRGEAELAEAYQLRGLLAQHQKRWDEAMRDLEQATALDPKEPRFLYSRLILEFQERESLTEDETAALKTKFERLTQIAQSPAQLLLAAHYLHLSGQQIAAMSLAERATQLSPTDPAVLDGYASLLEREGKLEDALRVQRSALAYSYEDQDEATYLTAHLRHLEERANARKPPLVKTRPVEASGEPH